MTKKPSSSSARGPVVGTFSKRTLSTAGADTEELLAFLEGRANPAKKRRGIDIDTDMVIGELAKRGINIEKQKVGSKRFVFSRVKPYDPQAIFRSPIAFAGPIVGKLKAKKPDDVLVGHLSARKLERIINKVSKVLGSQDHAMRWLGSPVRALDFATPISILGSKHGVKRVNEVLGQMEYGVW